jgi:hypothetical protein
LRLSVFEIKFLAGVGPENRSSNHKDYYSSVYLSELIYVHVHGASVDAEVKDMPPFSKKKIKEQR